MNEMHACGFDLTRRETLERLAVNTQTAGIGTMNTGENLDQGRLARPVFTHQPVNRSGLDLKVYAIQRLGGAKALADTLQVQGRWHRRDVCNR